MAVVHVVAGKIRLVAKKLGALRRDSRFVIRVFFTPKRPAVFQTYRTAVGFCTDRLSFFQMLIGSKTFQFSLRLSVTRTRTVGILFSYVCVVFDNYYTTKNRKPTISYYYGQSHPVANGSAFLRGEAALSNGPRRKHAPHTVITRTRGSRERISCPERHAISIRTVRWRNNYR